MQINSIIQYENSTGLNYHHSNWWPHKLVVDGLTYLEENKMNNISLAHNGQIELYGSKSITLWIIHLCSVFIWVWWWSVKVLVAHKDLQENFSKWNGLPESRSHSPFYKVWTKPVLPTIYQFLYFFNPTVLLYLYLWNK